MLTLITGAPGSGKSAALVDLLQTIGKDREVYAYGIPDLKIPHQELIDPAKWHETVPDGSIIVIDEVQAIWRTRGPGSKVPPDVAALETHRHRGIDFYIITQGTNLIDGNVRALVGRHIHLRDLGILGRFWYEWPEANDQHRTQWKNAPIKKRYRLPKSAFGLYKSASVHIKPVRSIPWMLAVMVLAIGATGFLTWLAYGKINDRLAPTKTATVAASPTGAASAPGQPAPPPAPALPKINDALDWIPRIASKPETAPAYDALRQVKERPRVAGALCAKSKPCKCYTQQGTEVLMTPKECADWLASTPFNPYGDLTPQQASERPQRQNLAVSPQQETPPPPVRRPDTTRQYPGTVDRVVAEVAYGP